MNNRTSTLQARTGIAASKPALEEQILLTSADSGCNSLASSSREQMSTSYFCDTSFYFLFPLFMLFFSFFECARKIFFHFWSAPSCSFLLFESAVKIFCISGVRRQIHANFFRVGNFFRFLVRRHFFPFFLGPSSIFFFHRLPPFSAQLKIYIYIYIAPNTKVTRVARGGCGAKAPRLAARPYTLTLVLHTGASASAAGDSDIPASSPTPASPSSPFPAPIEPKSKSSSLPPPPGCLESFSVSAAKWRQAQCTLGGGWLGERRWEIMREEGERGGKFESARGSEREWSCTNEVCRSDCMQYSIDARSGKSGHYDAPSASVDAHGHTNTHGRTREKKSATHKLR